nr:MAG TPA: hypothetical protein [Bacteriophage sp.]
MVTAVFLVFGRFGWFGNDARIGRCRCPYRSVRMSVSVGADVRIGRCRCPYRPTRMVLVVLRLHIPSRF